MPLVLNDDICKLGLVWLCEQEMKHNIMLKKKEAKAYNSSY